MKKTYFAVFEPDPSGAYSVYFPDLPGCITVGDSFEQACDHAREALDLHYYGLQEDHDPIPDPSDPSRFSRGDIEGNLIVPVTIFPDEFRNYMENKRVKTNCTIPKWLKRAGEETGINFSRLLENALKQELHLQ